MTENISNLMNQLTYESEKTQLKRQRLSVGKRLQNKRNSNNMRVSLNEEERAKFKKNPISAILFKGTKQIEKKSSPRSSFAKRSETTEI